MKFFALLATTSLLAACASGPAGPAASGKAFDQSGLPAAVQAPAGHRVALELVGKGDAIYQCTTFGTGTAALTHRWTFVRPDARLMDRAGKQVGRYFGPPPTWDITAGSRVSAKEQATAPASANALPYQLLVADPAMGSQDTFKGTTYVQRVNIQGGAVPTKPCEWMNDRAMESVPYQADYIFYRAAQ